MDFLALPQIPSVFLTVPLDQRKPHFSLQPKDRTLHNVDFPSPFYREVGRLLNVPTIGGRNDRASDERRQVLISGNLGVLTSHLDGRI